MAFARRRISANACDSAKEEYARGGGEEEEVVLEMMFGEESG